MAKWKKGLSYVALAVVALLAIDVIAVLAGFENEASVENTVFIDRPPEVVFDYAADMRHELEWNPDVEKMAKITDGPIGLGTRFAAKWKQSPDVIVECQRYDRPRELLLHNDGTLATDVHVTIVPDGAGTRFTSRFTARPRGAMKMVFPIFKLMMKKFEAANMGYLKAAIEKLPR